MRESPVMAVPCTRRREAEELEKSKELEDPKKERKLEDEGRER